MCLMCVPSEARRKHQIPRYWTYGQLEEPCGSWDLNQGSLQEQQPLTHLSIITDTSLQPQLFYLVYNYSWVYIVNAPWSTFPLCPQWHFSGPYYHTLSHWPSFLFIISMSILAPIQIAIATRSDLSKTTFDLVPCILPLSRDAVDMVAYGNPLHQPVTWTW